jgi:hypothetical protein
MQVDHQWGNLQPYLVQSNGINVQSQTNVLKTRSFFRQRRVESTLMLIYLYLNGSPNIAYHDFEHLTCETDPT